jgi:hypothetical protein
MVYFGVCFWVLDSKNKKKKKIGGKKGEGGSYG